MVKQIGLTKGERGYSMIEMLVVLGFIGVMCGVATYDFHSFERPRDAGAQAVASFFRQVRGRSIASTKTYTIKPSGSGKLVTTYSTDCASLTQTIDADLYMNMPSGSVLASTSWSVCYGTRGVADSSINIVVNDDIGYKTVQVALGGGVRVQ